MATVQEKIKIADEKKAAADAAFKSGNVKDALASYHFALMYLLGLDKNALQGLGMALPAPPSEDGTKPTQEKTEVDITVEKIYANMSACHLKNGNWQRALEAADKALAKNESNYKALFRKGKALGEIGYFEKAEKVLSELIKKSPEDAEPAKAELERLRAIDREREKAKDQKLKGFLSKKKAAGDAPPASGSA